MRWRSRSDPCALMGPQHRWIAWSHKRLRTEVMMTVMMMMMMMMMALVMVTTRRYMNDFHFGTPRPPSRLL